MSLPVNKEKSDAARAEGNTAFKRGRWTESIGHYTNAILNNPRDPLAYGNRAQAYLKLDKFADAERDCTSALSIQPGNVKALYRRALARKGLHTYDGAIIDLKELLKIEVGNQPALEELKEAEQLRDRLAAEKNSKPKRPFSPTKAPVNKEEPPAAAPIASSSIPSASIEEIPDDASVTSSAPTSKPSQSFSSLKSSRAGKKAAYVPPSTPTAPIEPKGATASEVPHPNAATPSISSKSATPSVKPPSAPPPAPSKPISVTPTPPTDTNSTATGTGILLLRALTPLSPSSGWALLRQYPPANVALILGPTLEPDSLGLILLASAAGVEYTEDHERVRTIMQGLKTTPRFSMNMMMLENAAADAGKQAWRESSGDGQWP